jgi:hypothetical protein
MPAQLSRLAAEASRELGRGATTEVVAGTWLVVGAPDYRAATPSGVALMRDAFAAYFNGRFRRGPSRAIAVYLFGTAGAYERYCRQRWSEPCISKYGFYHPSEHRLVMNAGLGLGTLTHELVHPILEADFPGAPTWINEGIASLFEAPVLPRPGEIHGRKNWRHPRLVAALANPGERASARLERLFGMPDGTFRGPGEDLHYSMARYLCQWLDGNGWLWPFYQRWRDGFAADPTGERTFAAVVGATPRETHARWERWVRGL